MTWFKWLLTVWFCLRLIVIQGSVGKPGPDGKPNPQGLANISTLVVIALIAGVWMLL
jgi:hypothetical protein